MGNHLLGFADAKIALDFHASREKNPSLFSNRAINKLWYAGYGIKSAVWDKKEVQSIDQVIAVEVSFVHIDLEFKFAIGQRTACRSIERAARGHRNT